jgi:hypothetical protein
LRDLLPALNTVVPDAERLAVAMMSVDSLPPRVTSCSRSVMSPRRIVTTPVPGRSFRLVTTAVTLTLPLSSIVVRFANTSAPVSVAGSSTRTRRLSVLVARRYVPAIEKSTETGSVMISPAPAEPVRLAIGTPSRVTVRS